MKNIIRSIKKSLIASLGLAIILVSCEYETKVRPADYPDQIIYLPAAYGGYFVIDDISRRIGNPPIEGQPYRYVVDLTERKFDIPLAVYRAGVNNNGGFTIDIAVNTDTINSLIAAGKLVNTTLLTADKYSNVSSVEMLDGEEIAKFKLSVKLDSLLSNYPDKIYALGVGISSTQRETNPDLATAIVVIHTKIIKPTASFTYSVDPSDNKRINFTNASLYTVSYSWNFGDGSAPSTDESPYHTYSTADTYTVTLTATGITGNEDKSTEIAVITIL